MIILFFNLHWYESSYPTLLSLSLLGSLGSLSLFQNFLQDTVFFSSLNQARKGGATWEWHQGLAECRPLKSFYSTCAAAALVKVIKIDCSIITEVNQTLKQSEVQLFKEKWLSINKNGALRKVLLAAFPRLSPQLCCGLENHQPHNHGANEWWTCHQRDRTDMSLKIVFQGNVASWPI